MSHKMMRVRVEKVADKICAINPGITREASVHGFSKNLASMIAFMEGSFAMTSLLHESHPTLSGLSKEKAYGWQVGIDV